MTNPESVSRYQPREWDDCRPIPLETAPTQWDRPAVHDQPARRVTYWRGFAPSRSRATWINGAGGHCPSVDGTPVARRPIMEGWLDPDGGFVMCAPWQHAAIAAQCLPDHPNPERGMEELGWVRIKGGESIGNTTDAQRAALRRGYE